MARLHLIVSPGAKRDDLERLPDGTIRASVKAPATEGKANQALRILLAERLKLPKSSISIARGASSRHKVIEVSGLPDDEFLARLMNMEKVI